VDFEPAKYLIQKVKNKVFQPKQTAKSASATGLWTAVKERKPAK
jgi:hypothetical protein